MRALWLLHASGASLNLFLAVSEMGVSVENIADTDNEDLGRVCECGCGCVGVCLGLKGSL